MTMPGNLYLTTAEFTAYGLADSTDPALIRVASDLVDAFCQRASLLVAQYTERNRLPDGRPVTRTTYTPLAVAQGQQTPFLSVRARHGIPRGPNALTLAARYRWRSGAPFTPGFRTIPFGDADAVQDAASDESACDCGAEPAADGHAGPDGY